MFLAVCPNPSVDTYVWVNSLAPGEVHRIRKEIRYPGGKGVHVALAAAELGEDVTLLGFWGGPTGEWIKQQCEQRNIRCVGPETEEWTRSCITFKSESEYDETELLGCGPVISIKDYQDFAEVFNQKLSDAEIVTMSGSWPAGAPEDGYAQLILNANNKNVPAFLDATGPMFSAGLNEGPFGIHLNRSEVIRFTGLDDFEKSFALLGQKVKTAAITAGKDGLFLGIEGKKIHGKIVLDKIHSAVGSGDCLTAGIAVGVKRKYEPEKIARLGVACGAANCLRKDLGMFFKKDVDDIFDKVQIQLMDK